jgi:hypothetical protein
MRALRHSTSDLYYKLFVSLVSCKLQRIYMTPRFIFGATPTGGAVRNTQQEPYAILRQPVGVKATEAVRTLRNTAYEVDVRTKYCWKGIT